jgi:hypothetical protein
MTDGSNNGMPFAYGTASFGRLKYGTDDEAERAADDLGLDGIHSHEMDLDGDGADETIHMPGADHEKLNKSLDEQGLPPKPGIKAMGSQTMGMGGNGGPSDDRAPDPMPDGFDSGDEVLSGLAPEQSRDSGLFGDRPDGASMFQFSGDSDDDDEMEIY